MSDKEVEWVTWQSKAELLSHLEASTAYVLVGGDEPHPRKFFSRREEPFGYELGVVSTGPGTKPATIEVAEGVTLVGHDSRVTWIDSKGPCPFAELSIIGSFFRFLRLPNNFDEVVVLHELGVLRVDATGREVWSVNTDITSEIALEATGLLLLTLWDNPKSLRVDPTNGALIRDT